MRARVRVCACFDNARVHFEKGSLVSRMQSPDSYARIRRAVYDLCACENARALTSLPLQSSRVENIGITSIDTRRILWQTRPKKRPIRECLVRCARSSKKRRKNSRQHVAHAGWMRVCCVSVRVARWHRKHAHLRALVSVRMPRRSRQSETSLSITAHRSQKPRVDRCKNLGKRQ